MPPSVILNMCSEQGLSSWMPWRYNGAAVSFICASEAITVPFLLSYKCEHWISSFHHFHTQGTTVASSTHLGAVFKLKSIPFSYWCYIAVAPSCTKSWCSKEVVSWNCNWSHWSKFCTRFPGIWLCGMNHRLKTTPCVRIISDGWLYFDILVSFKWSCQDRMFPVFLGGALH